MVDIHVEIDGLEQFKGIVDKNSQEFAKIKNNLVAHLQELRQNNWTTKGATTFDEVFKESAVDIDKLVKTMDDFVHYLNRKVQQAREIDELRM